jgi:hypothetical protein
LSSCWNSECGELGKYSRLGQNKDGTACGAACGFLTAIENGYDPERVPFHYNCYDYQMQYITSELHKRREKIMTCENENSKQTALVHQVYELSREFMEVTVSSHFGTAENSHDRDIHNAYDAAHSDLKLGKDS